MKYNLLIGLLSLGMAHGSTVDWQAWSAARHQDIDAAINRADEKTIEDLGRVVAAASIRPHVRPYPPEIREVRSEIFTRAQASLTSIPGHAEHYEKRIWEAHAAYKDPTSPQHSGSMHRYSRETMYGMRVLRNLASPETVRVLGEMLWEEWQKVPDPSSTVLLPGSLASIALIALGDLPLRDKPTPPFHGYEAKDRLPAWQAWYDEVKSGERTFSFKGQDVEYRFKPDGSWETISIANPPDDGPQQMEAKPDAPDIRGAPSQPDGPADQDTPTPWGWIWIPIVVVLIAGFFGLRMFRKGQS